MCALETVCLTPLVLRKMKGRTLKYLKDFFESSDGDCAGELLVAVEKHHRSNCIETLTFNSRLDTAVSLGVALSFYLFKKITQVCRLSARARACVCFHALLTDRWFSNV